MLEVSLVALPVLCWSSQAIMSLNSLESEGLGGPHFFPSAHLTRTNVSQGLAQVTIHLEPVSLEPGG